MLPSWPRRVGGRVGQRAAERSSFAQRRGERHVAGWLGEGVTDTVCVAIPMCDAAGAPEWNWPQLIATPGLDRDETAGDAGGAGVCIR
jgi:hypothetical protein